MNKRLGGMLVAVAGVLANALPATAGDCGATSYSCTSAPICDPQVSVPAQHVECKTCYKVVYDNVVEKRFHTTYKTVNETVMKQVCKTCYRDECKTCLKPCYETTWKEVCQTCYKPCYETAYRDCKYTVVKKVPVTLYRDDPKTVCRTVCDPVTKVHKFQVCKKICDPVVHEVCQKICKPVSECCVKDVCYQVCKQHCETIMKDECCTEYRECLETCHKICKKKVWRQYCYNKTVCKKCGEWVTETVCEPKKVKCVEECRDVCFDPCSCKTVCSPWKKVRDFCSESKPEVCCKKVWKEKITSCQVPCTRWVKEIVHEKVPYTICRKIPYNVVKKVPVNVTRCVRGAYVDAAGVGHDCEGEGRCFKEGAYIKKQVSYTQCKNVTEIIKTPVTTYVSRCEKGAYVDDKGVGHEHEATGYTWKAGAFIERAVTENVTRTVQETIVNKVPYTSYQTVSQECVKQVPYKVCKMVPYTTKKKVPVTVCKMVEQCQRCKVPYTVTECVPVTVCKKVAVCEPYEVCKKVARKVPVTVCVPVSDPGCCKSKMHCHKESRIRCGEPKCGGDGCGLFQKLFKGRMCCDPCGQ